MKKISILCAALAMAALNFTSCQKEESATANQKFIASFEQTGNDKVTVDDDLQMYWKDDILNSTISVFAPGYVSSRGDKHTDYYPTTISADGKTAILEGRGDERFPANQQGPFYAATSYISTYSSQINADGSFHVVGTLFMSNSKCMPMIARADNYGELKFKHLFGILKIIVNLPEGFRLNNVNITSVNGAVNPSYLNECDVTWDANGYISLANISFNTPPIILPISRGNGFCFAPVCPGDWGSLKFNVNTTDEQQQDHRFSKTMASNATIHIERAGITTLTLNLTENDMVN